jgi:hypothetical protein
MHSFARALNHMEVREIQLTGRKFTWSSNQSTPTLTRIDRAFCTHAWEDFYAQPHIQPLSSSTSNHRPLLITPLSLPKFSPKFKFESYWASMSRFFDKVKEAWTSETPNHCNHLATLHIKLSRTAKALKAWSKQLIPQGKVTMTVCIEVVDKLQRAQEN